ncbi:MAG: DAHL domain-containing protein [Sulfurimonas sp.]
MKKLKNIDAVSILLVLFIVVLSFLFYYLYKIEQGVANYNDNQNKLVTMKLLNKGFDDFTLVSSELSNYNLINKDLEKFRTVFQELQKSIAPYYPGDQVLQNSLEQIRISFDKKADDIEYFKSLNSSIIGGSHFLFDLQRTISETNDISSDTKNLVNETLFYLFQFSKSDYIDKSFVLNKLARVNKERKNIYLLNNFYNQSRVLLDTLASFRQTSNEIRKNKLQVQIDSLYEKLDKQYRHYLLEQQIIATLFFISTVIILIVFIILYVRSLKNQKTLRQDASVFENTEEAIIIADSEKVMSSL